MSDEDIRIALAEQKKEIGSLKHRMDEVEDIVRVVHQLAQEMVGLTKEVGFMNKNLTQLTLKVSDLEKAPVKRWDSLITGLIGAAAGAFVTFILK